MTQADVSRSELLSPPGSNCEELTLSKTSPLCPPRTTIGRTFLDVSKVPYPDVNRACRASRPTRRANRPAERLLLAQSSIGRVSRSNARGPCTLLQHRPGARHSECG